MRLYDGRGNDTPLLTIEKLHRFPVHLMAVSLLYLNETPDVTVTALVQRPL